MSLVLDSSVTLSWLYDDERTAATQRVLSSVQASHAWAPAIWHLEVANGLEMSVRTGRITRADCNDFLENLSFLYIRVDPETNEHAWSTTLGLASEYKLTLYDAAYLELSKRRRLPIASLDKQLRNAAKKEHLTLLGL